MEHDEHDRDGRYDDRADPGYIELAGGWCIPNSQVTGWPFHPRSLPVTAPRGGIKYPKPKETHMTEPRMTKAQIDNELRLNAELQETLRQRRLQLQEQARTAIPVEPLPFTMFSVAVRFKMRGKMYQYLILRNGSAYFTTGTKNEQKMFPSWAALIEWLEGPEVCSHSDIEILQSAGKAVSFTSGAIERMDPTDLKPPF